MIPTDPETFFSVYVPAQLAQLAPSTLGANSPGSLTCRVSGENGGLWNFRVSDGQLVVERAPRPDALVQLAASRDDFEALVVRAAEQFSGAGATASASLPVLRALTLDAERAQMLRQLPGSLRVAVRDATTVRNLWLLPGSAQDVPAAPDCQIECNLADLVEIQNGRTNPFELVMSGKIRIGGRPEVALALSALFT